jgi:hypothetical protein
MGPLTAAELESLGVSTIESLQALGWEEAFLRWVEAYPERLNVNAAVGLVAAELDVSWRTLSEKDKERARALVRRVRGEWGMSRRRTR